MGGSSIGGALGTGLGVLLAPETGGLSLALPALGGALGAGAGGMLSGDKNPLMDALFGGIGGGLTGGLSGGLDAAGLFGDAATGASGAAGAGALDAASTLGDLGATDGVGALGTGTLASPAGAAGTMAVTNGAAAGTDAGASTLGSIGKYLAKQNPLNLALAGNSLLSGAQSLMNPGPKFNVAGNANSVMATNPGFNTPLPKYTMQNTASPYAGNWYTYGQNPQTPLYNAMPVPVPNQARGGMVGYAHGGRVKGYAMGGGVMPPAQGMPPQMPPMAPPSAGMNPLQGAAMPPQGPKPVNPLALKAAHSIGMAIGKSLRKTHTTPDGRVAGKGGGQDDIVPAKLSKDEYILSADIPQALGDGSSEQGGKILDQFAKNIRAHKTKNGSGFPPKAKNPLSYLPKGVL